MLEINKKSNLLEQEVYHYTLQDVEEPNLYRELFPYDQIPKVSFNHRRVPMDMPEKIWITDTTFRDGQQSREPYTPEQIVDLFDMLHRLGGENGIIRQTEFFVYSEKDRKALELCQERGYKFPEITTWIRATKNDFQLVKDIGIEETGILTSCSDYHIFNKLNINRKKAVEQYTSVVKQALEMGIRPRCHLEDVTRADIYGFVLLFV
ncbi:MAG: 2-isopropylmalate synthase, partial [Oscillospiraceae bacterium]|nr:2-isopropylmalate synthase [Oscillospiraceae bacterium]